MLPDPRPSPTILRGRVATRILVAVVVVMSAVGPPTTASAAPDGSACAEQVVRDLRDGKFDAVAKLLVEPPSYDAAKADADREGSTAGLKAIVGTVGAIEDVKPMAGPRRYYRVQISGGTPESWSGVGRPMNTGIVERDVRFADAGPGVLILKLAKGEHACSLASLDIGLDAAPAGARDKMADVYVAVMQAVGTEGEPAELRKRAESMLTTYDAGGAASR